jgi:arylsulfatase
MWTVNYFVAMRKRHMAFKQKFPDREETHAQAYEGVSNLRPETKAMLERHYAAQKLMQ